MTHHWTHQPLLGSKPVQWEARRYGECAFPFDAPGGVTLSCCLPVDGEASYCAGHKAVVFTKAMPHRPTHSPKHGSR